MKSNLMEINYEIDKKNQVISYKSDITDIKYARFFAKKKYLLKSQNTFFVLHIHCTAQLGYLNVKVQVWISAVFSS